MDSGAVLWHDIECGSYAEDLPLWRELADAGGGPVLDVGAGTGRVSLELARAGHEVVALDVDAELLTALRERAGGLPVRTVVADARAFSLDRRFALILAPMQTVQLLGGAHAEFVRCAAAHLRPGGVLAAALADPPAFEPATAELRPLPDVRERDGWVFSSQPVAVRRAGSGMAIVRVRETVDPAGARRVEDDEVVLARVAAEELEAAGAAHGLRALPRRRIAGTDDYIGSEVVVLAA